jgi:hypothetical protein
MGSYTLRSESSCLIPGKEFLASCVERAVFCGVCYIYSVTVCVFRAVS